jgi:hypothetical protein
VTASAELLADPLVSFLRLPSPHSAPSPADTGLTFSVETLGPATPDMTALTVMPLDGEGSPAVIGRNLQTIARLDGAAPPLRVSLPAEPASAEAAVLAVFDWDNDFRMDLLVGTATGPHLLLQGAGGGF